MKKQSLLFLMCGMIFSTTHSQAQYKVYTEDITNFWEAYDSVHTTNDKNKQIDIIQRLYVDRGTVGLKEFMEVRGGTPEIWQMFINDDKERFEKIRPYTLSVLDQKSLIDESLEKFKNLYPDFKEGDIFFAIGIGNSGGTVKGNHVLIGCEVMATERPDWAHQIVLHEFVHTQQNHSTSGHVLSHSIHEGMADFISELNIDKKIADMYPSGHIAFAEANKEDLWKQFKKYIYSNDDYNYHGWLYGSPGQTIDGVNKIDLGYAMGYLICKSYYEQSDDKQAAIHEMLTTEFTDEAAREFLLKSGFVPKKDMKFIQNFEFASVAMKDGKKIKKEQYGYKIDGDEIVFSMKAKEVDFEINSLTVAGTFNNWKPKAEGYELELEKGRYKLRLPKKEFEVGKKHYFKFVANGDNWLHPPIEAKNAEGDGGGNTNLYIEL